MMQIAAERHQKFTSREEILFRILKREKEEGFAVMEDAEGRSISERVIILNREF